MKQYQPGFWKLIHHPEHLAAIKRGNAIGPIHLSLWPTRKCQQKCNYCMVRDDTGDEELTFEDFMSAINVLRSYGLKAVEFSGGGEPLLWPHFNDAVLMMFSMGIKISLITNGLAIDAVPKNILSSISWVRISINSVNHAERMFTIIDRNDTRYSFSLVTKNRNLIIDMIEFCNKNKIVCRVNSPKPIQEDDDNKLFKFVKGKNSKYVFYSLKKRGPALGCYMAWIRAAIDWRGYFLPCPAMHLSEEYQGSIPDKFRLCHISELEKWLNKNRSHDLGFRCSMCNCGKENNDYTHNLLHGLIQDVEFV